MADRDALADLDEAACNLLKLYELAGVQAILIAVVDDVILVRCQDAEDVAPLVKRVAEEYAPKSGRTLN